MTVQLRRGVVLPLALIALTILGVAVASGSFLERSDTRAARSAHLHASAAGIAESGTLAAFGDVAAGSLDGLAVGASRSRIYHTGDPTVRAALTVTRLGETLFALRAVAHAVTGPTTPAREATQLLVALDAIDPPTRAAIASRDSPRLGDAIVDGRDMAGGDDCPPPATDSIPTEPVSDSAAIDSIRAVLRGRASVRYAGASIVVGPRPSVVETRCDPIAPHNWGDPAGDGPCASYRPVIHAAGDLTVDGGAGQGTLVVDGNLTLAGGVRFDGVILVHGTLDVVGAGATVTGSVIAGAVDLSAASGTSRVVRSMCAARRALRAAAPLVPLVERQWMSLR